MSLMAPARRRARSGLSRLGPGFMMAAFSGEMP